MTARKTSSSYQNSLGFRFIQVSHAEIQFY